MLRFDGLGTGRDDDRSELELRCEAGHLRPWIGPGRRKGRKRCIRVLLLLMRWRNRLEWRHAAKVRQRLLDEMCEGQARWPGRCDRWQWSVAVVLVSSLRNLAACLLVDRRLLPGGRRGVRHRERARRCTNEAAAGCAEGRRCETNLLATEGTERACHQRKRSGGSRRRDIERSFTSDGGEEQGKRRRRSRMHNRRDRRKRIGSQLSRSRSAFESVPPSLQGDAPKANADVQRRLVASFERARHTHHLLPMRSKPKRKRKRTDTSADVCQ